MRDGIKWTMSPAKGDLQGQFEAKNSVNGKSPSFASSIVVERSQLTLLGQRQRSRGTEESKTNLG
jgi:hypothetical protein